VSAAPSVDVLRESVRRAVAASTLRTVAAQIGVTHRTAGKFLAGTPPQEKTLRKLREWYVRHAGEERNVSTETVGAALALLTDGLPEKYREGAERDVLDVLRKAHRAAGTKPPRWIGR
jgi:hypothetical protein